ncbi:MAG: hypothetical protein WDO68_18795 [Gammaproteobacteria bacterium]
MNDSAPLVNALAGEQVLHNEHEAHFGFHRRFSDPDLISDDDLGLQRIGLDTELDKPGGRRDEEQWNAVSREIPQC